MWVQDDVTIIRLEQKGYYIDHESQTKLSAEDDFRLMIAFFEAKQDQNNYFVDHKGLGDLYVSFGDESGVTDIATRPCDDSD